MRMMMVFVGMLFLAREEGVQLKGKEFEVWNAAGEPTGWVWKFSKGGAFQHRHGERKVEGSWLFTGRSLIVTINEDWHYRVRWNEERGAVQLDYREVPTFFLVEAKSTVQREAEPGGPKF